MSSEMEYLTTHARELSEWKGEWLLIVGQELVTHSADFDEIQRTIRSRDIKAPFLYYVPAPEESNFIF